MLWSQANGFVWETALALRGWVLLMKIQPLESRGLSEMAKHTAGQRNLDERLKNKTRGIRNQVARGPHSAAGRSSLCPLDAMKSEQHITIQAPVGFHLISFVAMKKLYNVDRIFNLWCV